MEAAADTFDSRLKRVNQTLVRLGDYSGADIPIWFLCKKHWEWRRQRPKDALKGHELKCCLIASNTKRSQEERDKALARYLSYLKDYEGGNFALAGTYIDSKPSLITTASCMTRSCPSGQAGFLLVKR